MEGNFPSRNDRKVHQLKLNRINNSFQTYEESETLSLKNTLDVRKEKEGRKKKKEEEEVSTVFSIITINE